MTLYQFLSSELTPEIRQKLTRWGVLSPRIERDIAIYTDWLQLRNHDKKMDVYAELAERYGVSETTARMAINFLGTEIE